VNQSKCFETVIGCYENWRSYCRNSIVTVITLWTRSSIFSLYVHNNHEISIQITSKVSKSPADGVGKVLRVHAWYESLYGGSVHHEALPSKDNTDKHTLSRIRTRNPSQ